ncbi:MAG: DUF2510 domain-containing protein [Candidatus Microbacterium colombiense]|nr:MAG: DUF2510 domain-containing protein [Microbacterium sp.]
MTTPAGWYDDGSGRQRWWDGQQWTEHFAPETTAPETAAPETSAPETTAPETTAPAVAEEPSLDDTVIRIPEEPSATETPVDAPVESPVQDWSTPGASAPTTPLGDGYPAPAYPAAAPEQPYGGYPGAAPAAPGAYAQSPSGFPAAAPYAAVAPEAPKKLSILGIVGLGLSALGTILVFIPLVGVFGFVLLAAGFVVSLISLFLKGKKWPGITGLVLAVVGTIIGIVISVFYFFAAVQGVSTEIDRPSSSASPSTGTEESDAPDDGAAGGPRPTTAEVAEGVTAIFGATGADGYTEAQISCLSDLLVTSDLDDDTLRTIAESDGTLTDVDAAYGFAEVLSDTETVSACFMQ